MRELRWCPLAGLLVVLIGAPTAFGQATESAEPFKVGTFDIDGVPRVGLVLRDSLVVDIAEANRGLEADPAFPVMPMPADMLELIGRYEYGLKYRLYEIVNHLVGNDLLGSDAPDGSTRDLLRVSRYDFNWQTTYQLAEPVWLPAGTRVRVKAVFDNSAGNPSNPDPTVDVRWGLESTDEMLNGLVDYVAADGSR